MTSTKGLLQVLGATKNFVHMWYVLLGSIRTSRHHVKLAVNNTRAVQSALYKSGLSAEQILPI